MAAGSGLFTTNYAEARAEFLRLAAGIPHSRLVSHRVGEERDLR